MTRHSDEARAIDQTDPSSASELLSISDTEAATGVSREVLRVWERRYGFPSPARDSQGDRRYSPEQIEKLRLIRLLQGCGFRPGKLVELGIAELDHLLHARASYHDEYSSLIQEELLEALKHRDATKMREYLGQRIMKYGLHEFVFNFMPCANFIVGDEWQKGRLEIHEEHLYTEQIQAALNVAMSGLLAPLPQSPKVMICTASGEPHTLGLAMVEAILRLNRVNVTSFGPEMPVKVIVQAAQKHGMHVVALSFSASYSSSRMIEFLDDLRFRLPSKIQIWAGGAATDLTRRQVEGVRFIGGLQDLQSLMAEFLKSAESQHSSIRH